MINIQKVFVIGFYKDFNKKETCINCDEYAYLNEKKAENRLQELDIDDSFILELIVVGNIENNTEWLWTMITDLGCDEYAYVFYQDIEERSNYYRIIRNDIGFDSYSILKKLMIINQD